MTEYPIMEAFYTIQGEGRYTGHAAYFIRLGGCDVGCVWCDVKESWDATAHPNLSIDQILSQASEYPSKLIVITGGEPLMYDMNNLTSALKNKGFQLNIETSGAYPFSGQWDWVCFSPKKFMAPHESIYAQANELKVIIAHKSDFDFAVQHAQKVNKDCLLYLQVEWSKREKLNPLLTEFVKSHPEWQLSIQSHKYLDIP